MRADDPKVVQFSGCRKEMARSWHRRHALQLAAQMPDQAEDCLIILDVMRDLVADYIADNDSS